MWDIVLTSIEIMLSYLMIALFLVYKLYFPYYIELVMEDSK